MDKLCLVISFLLLNAVSRAEDLRCYVCIDCSTVDDSLQQTCTRPGPPTDAPPIVDPTTNEPPTEPAVTQTSTTDDPTTTASPDVSTNEPTESTTSTTTDASTETPTTDTTTPATGTTEPEFIITGVLTTTTTTIAPTTTDTATTDASTTNSPATDASTTDNLTTDTPVTTSPTTEMPTTVPATDPTTTDMPTTTPAVTTDVPTTSVTDLPTTEEPTTILSTTNTPTTDVSTTDISTTDAPTTTTALPPLENENDQPLILPEVPEYKVEMLNGRSRRALSRTLREIKRSETSGTRCVVTSFTENSKTVVVRGCSFESGNNDNRCREIIGGNFSGDIKRCDVCQGNLCNSAAISGIALTPLLIAILLSI